MNFLWFKEAVVELSVVKEAVFESLVVDGAVVELSVFKKAIVNSSVVKGAGVELLYLFPPESNFL